MIATPLPALIPAHRNTSLGTVMINGPPQYSGRSYARILWQFFRCNACSRGAVAKIHDNGSGQSAVLKDFLPSANESGSPCLTPEWLGGEDKHSISPALHTPRRRQYSVCPHLPAF